MSAIHIPGGHGRIVTQASLTINVGPMDWASVAVPFLWHIPP